MKREVFARLIVPALLALVGSIAYFAVLLSWNFELSSLLIFIITLLYIKFFEWRLPLKDNWKAERKELFTDLKHLFISSFMFDAIGKSLSLALVLYIQEIFFTSWGIWDALPFLLSFLLANLIGELLPYVYHRISHKGDPNSYFSLFLWRIHSIHHLPVSLNWFKTNWAHPINIFLNSLLKFLPLLLLGFSKEMIFLVGVTHVVIAYLSHANIYTQTGWLDYVIVTPKLHQFHHSTRLEEAQNYGNILPFWDLLFGTYFRQKNTVEEVGVSTTDPSVYPDKAKFWEQIIFPFSTIRKECCKINRRKGVVS